ncbi:MAG: hypothetical protein WC291_06550 [Thermodesulfovibrionales bacterium]|jgi:hypothetical protein
MNGPKYFNRLPIPCKLMPMLTVYRDIPAFQCSPSKPIELDFTRENALAVLSWGAIPEESPYSHKQIAEWCDKFWCKYLDIDPPKEIEELLPILTDIDDQWELYLVNTYSLRQLQEEDFEHVILPVEWFKNWLRQALSSKQT